MSTGRPSEALAELRLANELDYLNHLPLNGIGWIYSNLRQYDKALEYRQDVWDLKPGFAVGPLARIEYNVAMQQGRYAEAAKVAEAAYRETGSSGDFLRRLHAEWRLGNQEEVYSVYDSLRSTGELQRWEQDNLLQAISIYGIMGERDRILDLLEMAYEHPRIWFISLSRQAVYDPILDFLRADPRFKALMQRMGVTEVFDENGNLLQPLDETLEAYNAPGSR